MKSQGVSYPRARHPGKCAGVQDTSDRRSPPRARSSPPLRRSLPWDSTGGRAAAIDGRSGTGSFIILAGPAPSTTAAVEARTLVSRYRKSVDRPGTIETAPGHVPRTPLWPNRQRHLVQGQGVGSSNLSGGTTIHGRAGTTRPPPVTGSRRLPRPVPAARIRRAPGLRGRVSPLDQYSSPAADPTRNQRFGGNPSQRPRARRRDLPATRGRRER